MNKQEVSNLSILDRIFVCENGFQISIGHDFNLLQGILKIVALNIIPNLIITMVETSTSSFMRVPTISFF